MQGETTSAISQDRISIGYPEPALQQKTKERDIILWLLLFYAIWVLFHWKLKLKYTKANENLKPGLEILRKNVKFIKKQTSNFISHLKETVLYHMFQKRAPEISEWLIATK